jgi:hypothetical protein
LDPAGNGGDRETVYSSATRREGSCRLSLPNIWCYQPHSAPSPNGAGQRRACGTGESETSAASAAALAASEVQLSARLAEGHGFGAGTGRDEMRRERNEPRGSKRAPRRQRCVNGVFSIKRNVPPRTLMAAYS